MELCWRGGHWVVLEVIHCDGLKDVGYDVLSLKGRSTKRVCRQEVSTVSRCV